MTRTVSFFIDDCSSFCAFCIRPIIMERIWELKQGPAALRPLVKMCVDGFGARWKWPVLIFRQVMIIAPIFTSSHSIRCAGVGLRILKPLGRRGFCNLDQSVACQSVHWLLLRTRHLPARNSLLSRLCILAAFWPARLFDEHLPGAV